MLTKNVDLRIMTDIYRERERERDRQTENVRSTDLSSMKYNKTLEP